MDTVYKDANTSYVNNTDYDSAGRVDVRDLGGPSGSPVIRVDYTYFNWTDVNGQGRLQRITSGIMTNLDSLQDLRYTYDANGNVLTIQDYLAGSPQTQTFTYDTLDRIYTAQASGGSYGTYSQQTYTYRSSTGNLSNKAGVSYTYGDTNHKHAVTATVSDTYTYDADGNQTQRVVSGNTYNMSYNAENRLVGVSGAVIATFVYDGDGNRVKGTVSGTTTAYLGEYFEWTGSTGSMRKYYFAGSTRVAMSTGTTLRFLLGDHLGSTSITTNSSGSFQAEQRYYPWGTVRYWSGSFPTNYQFTDQRVESNLGWYFYNARWYDPAAGRFMQPDTIVPGGVQGLDRYAYVGNNPLRYTDPSGHGRESTDCGPDGMYCEQNRIGCNNIRCSILHDYGVELVDTGSNHHNGSGPKAWNSVNTMQVYSALGIVNNAVNGKLKSLIGGSVFTLNDYTEGYYHGNTDKGYIDFETGVPLPPPYINIFHEVGHLIDVNSAGGNYYSGKLANQNRNWITPEGRIDTNALLNKEISDPYWPNPQDALQGTNHTGQGPNEQWADTLENYVAGNIDVLTTAGNDMYNFTSDFFVP